MVRGFTRMCRLCVRYQLHEDSEDWVRIDSSTGEVILASELDHERTAFLRFRVLATDDSDSAEETPTAASALVIVAVINEDDEVPVFEHDSYRLSVLENQPPMTLVGHVVAKDADAPPYDELQYRLNGGLDADAFVLDPKTGSLQTRKTLDRERKSEYHVTVMATSAGRAVSRHRAFANVTVQVGDLNDHAPVVVSPPGGNGTARVTSSALPGQLVTRIRARDADVGPNGHLTYYWNSEIETETEGAPPPFRVEPETGSVFLTAPLSDVPDGTTYRLNVLVRDNGTPPTASAATLFITVDRDILGAERSRYGAATVEDAAGEEKFRFVLEGKLQLAVVIGVIVLCVMVAGALLAAIVVCRRRRIRCPPDGATCSDGKPGDLGGGGAAVRGPGGGEATTDVDYSTEIIEPAAAGKVKPKPLAAIVTVSKNDRLQVGLLLLLIIIITLRAKLRGAVYCYRSCLWACLQRTGGVRTLLQPARAVFASLLAFFHFGFRLNVLFLYIALGSPEGVSKRTAGE